jgi:hypothetical protein
MRHAHRWKAVFSAVFSLLNNEFILRQARFFAGIHGGGGVGSDGSGRARLSNRTGPASFEGGEGSRQSVSGAPAQPREGSPNKAGGSEAVLEVLTDLAHVLLNQNRFYYGAW